jgi:flagellar hook-basal body complex protein FliE
MPTPSVAANAYAALSKITESGRSLSKSIAGGDDGKASFGSMLKEALGSVVDAGHKSDAQMRAVATGKANMVDVVTAVSETEVAVDALVAVRDRVIQSYEDIMKMPI